MRAAMDPAVSLSTYSPLPMDVFVDHVDHAAPRAPGRWTTVRPRIATSQRWEDVGVESQAERCTRVN